MDLLFEGYSLKMRCATFVDTFPVNEFFTAVRNDHASSPLCRSRNEELTLLIRSTNLLYEDKPAFDGIMPATLVHWDMWEGNVFIHNGHVSGIIDWERAMWGEAFMDDRFRYHSRNKSFLMGFGQTAFTGDEIKRIRWYDIILYLTMMIEVYYREYETESQYFWAKDKLMTIWSDDASF